MVMAVSLLSISPCLLQSNSSRKADDRMNLSATFAAYMFEPWELYLMCELTREKISRLMNKSLFAC